MKRRLNFAENTYQIMRKKKMNQAAVARAGGLTPKTFNAILRGRKLLREEFIVPLCGALDVTTNELFGYPDKPPHILSMRGTSMQRGSDEL